MAIGVCQPCGIAPDWLPPDRGGCTRRNVDGTLVAECTGHRCMVQKTINGKRTIAGGTRRRITEFAPGDNRRGARTHQQFMEALVDYDKALDDRDADRLTAARERLEATMTKTCTRCRQTKNRSQTRAHGPREACKKTYHELLLECGRDGVAACVDCGTTLSQTLEHTKPDKKERRVGGKRHGEPVDLSNFAYWAHQARAGHRPCARRRAKARASRFA